MARSVGDEGKKVNSTINVTPMVDVMLVLLIIFMVITPLLPPGHGVELAKAENPQPMPDAEKEDSFLIAINREGNLFLGNAQIRLADLEQKIKERSASRPGSKVFVKADARVHYGMVVEVVDSVRSAGVSDLGLLTEPRKQ